MLPLRRMPLAGEPDSNHGFTTSLFNDLVKDITGSLFLHYKIKFPKLQAFTCQQDFCHFFKSKPNTSFLITHFSTSFILNSPLKSGTDEIVISVYCTLK